MEPQLIPNPNPKLPALIVPTIHLNGSGSRSLLEDHCKAMAALMEAMDTLPHPNGRDYYPQGNTALETAITQARRWQETVAQVRAEIEAVAVAITEQKS